MRSFIRGRALARRSIALLACAAGTAGAQTKTYPIDLPTALRLADAQNLDVQLARERVKEALANRSSAIEQFIPWLAPGVTWHRREGVAQASPSGIIGDAEYVGYSPGIGLNAQSTLGDAIYNSLATKQLVHASDEGLAVQRQDAVFQAASGYLDLAKAKALVDVIRDALATSQN
jgi:outer membrane protein TolC